MIRPTTRSTPLGRAAVSTAATTHGTPSRADVVRRVAPVVVPLTRGPAVAVVTDEGLPRWRYPRSGTSLLAARSANSL